MKRTTVASEVRGQPLHSPTGGISACIVCRNEADKLRACLESLSWVDEVVVLDLASSDGSAQVAGNFGATVITRDPVPIVEMVRNEVADRAAHDWILVLDPDERVSPALAVELRRIATAEDVDAVVIPRMNFDLGFPPSHPLQRYEPQLRMYRRSRVAWPEIPNALPIVAEERLYRLPPRDELVIVHDRNRSIPEAVERAMRYAPLQAQSMIDAGQRFTAIGMAHAMASVIYKQFFVGQAWRDGVPGILRAAILVGFKFYIWAAFWQLSSGRRTPADDAFLRRVGMVMEAFRYLVAGATLALRLPTGVGRRLSKLRPASTEPAVTRATSADSVGSSASLQRDYRE